MARGFASGLLFLPGSTVSPDSHSVIHLVPNTRSLPLQSPESQLATFSQIVLETRDMGKSQ